jgi:FkbM family methyltransferase
VRPLQNLSYAQRFEDLRLLRCFEDGASGFYIDIGAGHPVYDNVSFVFYLRSWRGITVEPNPWLAQLSEAVRPRDARVAALVGAEPGEATYYLVEDFHGLSTTVEHHARAAQSEYGKRSQAMAMPVTTLRALCEQHAAGPIDVLKIDVEGAEREVLLGGDWQRFRPKIVVAEALAPVTLVPAWDAWEPLLIDNGYRFAASDGLNRYYVAKEHWALAERLAANPDTFAGVEQLRNFGPALDDTRHPDHRLARLFAGEDMVRLPLLAPDAMVSRLTAGLDPAALQREAQPADRDALHDRLFGISTSDRDDSPLWAGRLSLRDLYERAIASDPFRAACGRISASYAW